MIFHLIAFNPRRWVRGAAAAQVRCTDEEDGSTWLWMTERDLRNNIREFGEHPGLCQALACYSTPGVEYPPPADHVADAGNKVNGGGQAHA